mgnify:CR=1 FL=1
MHIKNTPNEKLDKFFFLPKNDDRRGEGGLRTKGFNKKTEYNKPLISIITVSYNSSSTIEDTIKSVLILPYKNIDYIIIDGGSDDTTVEKIKKYDNQINYWISESDNGIYDAMNKGIQCAQGEYLFFLNSDDVFINTSINEIYNILISLEYDIVYGNIKIKGKDIITKPISKTKSKNIGYLEPWLKQPASFIKKSVYNKLGNFDVRFNISGDTEFLMRVVKSDFKDCYLDIPFTQFSIDGISNRSLLNPEHLLLRKKHRINIFLFIKTEMIRIIKNVIYRLYIKIIPGFN